MLSKELNQRVSCTGAGTPGGELMRRYWQPIALSKEVAPSGKPRQLKIMGEDLVLFRDEAGTPGLLGLHCSHRLTSLAYGRVEDGGIRCPFHGWLYDASGHCLEQPAEPEGSTFKERIRHPAYPCEELGGLIFTYMGPSEKRPLLPRYELLVREDGARQVSFYPINSNYLQNVEGAVDAVHFPFLHTDNWSKKKQALFAMPRPHILLEETDWGVRQMIRHGNPMVGDFTEHYAHFFMPAGFMRISPRGRPLKYQSWYVPVDDTHCLRFQCGFAPHADGFPPYEWPDEDDFLQPGPWNDYFRDYDNVDTISGIPGQAAPGTAVKGFLCQDSMVNESQGPIVDRTLEHLGMQDRPMSSMRTVILRAIEDVEAGRDPKHILRDPAANHMVRVAGNAAPECA
ncbi:MAG: phthalate 4,5-dioxygenase [Chloroflexi bacterium]|nr:phthalate 4,5-dioxygenase [Chloroflexota bacterium]